MSYLSCSLQDVQHSFNQQRQRVDKAIFNSDLLATNHWHSISDVTLTFRQATKSPDGQWARLDAWRCKDAFRHFMNLLNRAVYKNAFRRHGKRLRVIPILEKDADGKEIGRWHFHAAIERPPTLSHDQLRALITDCWSRTNWGYRKTLVRDSADHGWVDYMLKPRQKSTFEMWSDAIDWDNLHNPAC